MEEGGAYLDSEEPNSINYTSPTCGRKSSSTRSAKNRTTLTSALVFVTPSYRHKQNKETSLELFKTERKKENVIHLRGTTLKGNR